MTTQSSRSSNDASLVEFVVARVGEDELKIDEDYGDGFVRLRLSEAERRQAAQDIRSSEDILIELIRNSRDAGAENIFIATSTSDKRRTITVIDDGSGIPERLHEKIFEPRVTSKLEIGHEDFMGFHGRGMALYSIAVKSKEAKINESEFGIGTAITVDIDLNELKEKSDQSSFPNFESIDGIQVMRGPKNLIRYACEFAIDSAGKVSIYIGTPAEICSSLYQISLSKTSSYERAFRSELDGQKIPLRLGFATDPKDLRDISKSIGLDISERTARRIMDGDIQPAENLLDIIQARLSDQSNVGVKRTMKGRSLAPMKTISKVKISKDDLDRFKEDVRRAFSNIAESYYLENDIDPMIKIEDGDLVVKIDLREYS